MAVPSGPVSPPSPPLGAALVDHWSARAVSVTLGRRGALLSRGDEPPVVVPPALTAADGDPCGAGDCFAATAALALAGGAVVPEAVEAAVHAAARFVHAGGASALEPAAGYADTAGSVVDRVRAAGGTVVATGGCFDLLHAGHVETLRAARSLGDCLVVLLNSDDSVRRLKGPERPIVPQADRARVLEALDPVDAVVVFDEQTPVEAIRRLRPDVWAKGGDYSVQQLPEAEVLAEWGGQTVVLPYLDGRSTTRLVAEARAAARG
ncbi:D-glycero-beta-D-manno-heptose 1-phosphate adenylyltransferase [Nocardioides sp. TF02-7]|uniref:D-glycero-beta-D-manno-heptose 1-phosphate adenylyltransferase n=1 Tax=Nocardioides sp. TF02-7 TaxID=2917724 RepID=UPI001F0653AF|nr:D-glycero-beta-D-manno-heptose 1-phosphate adenylyltransferase [Nocardioides sp. TF02-7]UMG93649.1 D-glycero-beta-D-manno-heptose 1-phosphate adenylyltransferase [Nocardioides sp. TF02-7]